MDSLSSTPMAGSKGCRRCQSPSERPSCRPCRGGCPRRPGFANVITKGQTLMGADAARATFAPRAPLATAVESNQPEFMWSALSGATAYVVSVYDDQFALVLESPSVAGTSWRPHHIDPTRADLHVADPCADACGHSGGPQFLHRSPLRSHHG